MAAKKKTAKKPSKKVAVESYRHESARRKNIPTAKIAAEGTVPRVAKAKYAYSAHLSPELRFAASGQSDRVTEIVEKAAAANRLTKEEADILRGIAANASQPWLEWSGKKEEHDRGVLEVEPVALHIHERVSANAIIRAAKREDVQADLFADPQQEYKEAIQFYRHDVDWANRLILGDSLEVMSSLSRRESLGEKFQTIYIDPPYGVKFASNFQSEVGNRDVQDRDAHLSREAEVVKAYRDTWELGVHSYLSYMRDRLVLCRELLSDRGSIFVQISDENLHLLKQIMDEVFGRENSMSVISFAKTGAFAGNFLSQNYDYILWYAKDKKVVKYRQLWQERRERTEGGTFSWTEGPTGALRRLSSAEKLSGVDTPCFRADNITGQGATKTGGYEIRFTGKRFVPSSGRHWSSSRDGMERLIRADRVMVNGRNLAYKRFENDFPITPITSVWNDTILGTFSQKWYAVQTGDLAVQRCILMTSDPGDLVLDPTSGSGTTAAVAERWGRRWVAIDSSRVAVSIARQRLLTSKFDAFEIVDDAFDKAVCEERAVDPRPGFRYESVPHVKLGSIANNMNLDPIIESHDEILTTKLDVINEVLVEVTDTIRADLVEKLAAKYEQDGARSVTDSDRRRWLLPSTSLELISGVFKAKSKQRRHFDREAFAHVPSEGRYRQWEVPFDVDPCWPVRLAKAVTDYRNAWKDRIAAINKCIASNAEQEVMYDRPVIDGHFARVTGPFTVEGVRPEELSLDENGELFDPSPNEWEVHDDEGGHSQNASAYLDRMFHLIGQDGVTFPNNEHRKFALIERLEESDAALHAEALWEGAEDGAAPNIAIAFGPQHGPVTASQVEDLIRASRRFDELIIAAFSFDGSSQAVIQESVNPRLRIHMAHIRPDVSPGMDGLLKDSPKSQLFTVFGQPEIEVRKNNSEVEVELLGVDIYSPLTGEITSSGANKVAAWFLDSNYDRRCFCITQAFFPNQNAWDKIAKALRSSADAEAFEAFNGTVSVPFKPGEHQRIAVKVIDPRGNEVMAIRSLKDAN